MFSVIFTLKHFSVNKDAIGLVLKLIQIASPWSAARTTKAIWTVNPDFGAIPPVKLSRLNYLDLDLDSVFWNTRSYAALRAADLDWIVGPGYSLGGYILEKNHENQPKTMKNQLGIGGGLTEQKSTF